jgi:iron-sulfur cluster assembly accessory protein
LRAGYTRIQDSSIRIGFLAAPVRADGVAVGDRLTGGLGNICGCSPRCDQPQCSRVNGGRLHKARVHVLQEDCFQRFVRRLPSRSRPRSIRVTAMTETVLPPFVVTAAAIRQLELMGGHARVDIQAGGCCGSTYVFTQEAGSESDTRYGCIGAELFVSDAARAVLTGATLDYSATVRPARFRVLRNPNTPERCPCNRSFGRDWPGKGQPGCAARRPMPWDA